MSITVEATKDWINYTPVCVQVCSVPKGLWTGKAEIVWLDPASSARSWARVFDGRSAAWGSVVFGDQQSMSAFTDLLVVQFFAEGDEQGTARGTFDTADIRLPKKVRFELPPLRIVPRGRPKKPGPVEIDVPVPHYAVLEGAVPLRERELQQIVGRSWKVTPVA